MKAQLYCNCNTIEVKIIEIVKATESIQYNFPFQHNKIYKENEISNKK